MSRLITLCTLIAVISASLKTVPAADGPSPEVPELAALDHYVGEWDDEITTEGLPFTKGQGTAQWILGGRFVQQTGELQSADGTTVMHYSSLMTYDTSRRSYRTWLFLSDGHTGESIGTWDATRRVMTSVSEPDANGTRSTTTADFSVEGVESWKIVNTRRDGQTVGGMSGKNTRRPK